MKKSTIICLLALCAGSMIISGYNTGAGTHGWDCTGAETGLGNPSGCTNGGCHTLSTTITVALELDSAGVATTHYVGGMSYTVKITGTNTSTTSLPKFGLQIGCIKGSTAVTTPVNAGTWPAPYPANTHFAAPQAGNFVVGVVEHNTPITATTGTGGSGTTYSKTFNWVAPATGTGTVSFWSCLNAVNGNGSDTGDKFNKQHIVINEWPLGVGVNNLNPVHDLNISMFPNPAVDQLTLSFTLENQAMVKIKVYDVTGKEVLNVNAERMDPGQQSVKINTSSLLKGIYFVNVSVDGISSSKKLIIQ